MPTVCPKGLAICTSTFILIPPPLSIPMAGLYVPIYFFIILEFDGFFIDIA